MINRGYFSRGEFILCLLCRPLLFFIQAFRSGAWQFPRSGFKCPPAGERLQLRIQPLIGGEPELQKLVKRLMKLRRDLAGIYLHGSLASGDRVAYSDVDVIVVIRNGVRQRSWRWFRLIYTLNQCLIHFYRLDPLQHHGWMVFDEDDLTDFPIDRLPVDLLRESRSLLPGVGENLVLRVREYREDPRQALYVLARSIVKKLAHPRYPADLYQLKCLLSEFMLLPAVYLGTRDNAGALKKQSFERAKKDFSAVDWRVMEEISEIRLNWDLSMSGWRRFVLTRSNPAWRRLFLYLFAPPIPNPLAVKLNSAFYRRMARLADLFIDVAGENEVHRQTAASSVRSL